MAIGDVHIRVDFLAFTSKLNTHMNHKLETATERREDIEVHAYINQSKKCCQLTIFAYVLMEKGSVQEPHPTQHVSV